MESKNLFSILHVDLDSLILALEQVALNQRNDELTSRINRFIQFLKEPPAVVETDDFEAYRSRITQWVDSAGSMLNDIDAGLRELRWRTSVGAKSAP